MTSDPVCLTLIAGRSLRDELFDFAAKAHYLDRRPALVA